MHSHIGGDDEDGEMIDNTLAKRRETGNRESHKRGWRFPVFFNKNHLHTSIPT
jgi:hypothetical protein